MSKRTKEVDAYIDGAPAFARPILKRIRACYHRACPEIQETIKWGFPTFEHKGIVGNMAAFKSHAAYRFWNSGKIQDPHGILAAAGETSMGGRRLTDVSQLPSDEVFIDYIRRAVELKEKGVKPRAKKARKAAPLRVPAVLSAALKKSAKAAENFAAMSTSCRNEYIEWISEAKQEATRNRRLATALEWLEQGKSRNWKYERR